MGARLLSMSPARPPSNAQLARLLLALQDDEQLEQSARRPRDDAFSATLPADASSWTRIMRWLDFVDGGNHLVARQTESGLRNVASLMMIAGALVGWISVLGAFYYDGSTRVNVAAVLGILVGVPFAALLLSLVAMFHDAWPGLSGVISSLSIGRLGAVFQRFVEHESRRGLSVLMVDDAQSHPGLSAYRRWQYL
ncbi:MAG: hypothetical protein HOI95_17045, partial [Chromatiales bacterium]|nr:hypothetical protein [Chromatiales bacterium]